MAELIRPAIVLGLFAGIKINKSVHIPEAQQTTMQDVYIRSAGSFLPGEPIHNDQMEQYLGKVHGHESRGKALSLRQNGIKTRHYAINLSGGADYTVANMATRAVQDAFKKNTELKINGTDYLAVSGSFGDRILPGLASPVQHELRIPEIEIASFQSVCGAAGMALKAGMLQVKAGDKCQAVVVGADFFSRIMRATHLECSELSSAEAGLTDLSVDFLRWILSDGAGALVLSNKPNKNKPSLRIDWVDVVSYADRFDVCMQMGGRTISWANAASPAEAVSQGSFTLHQDFKILRELFPIWVNRLCTLGKEKKFKPEDVDWCLCHFSSYALGWEIQKIMKEKNFKIPSERWFSNLATKGNTGAASIFIMLDEFFNEKDLKSGERILLAIPESGWGLVAYAMLTVV